MTHFPAPESSSTPAPTPAPAPARPVLEGWVHRTPQGVELGGEHPTGHTQSALDAFAEAFQRAWAVRETLWVLVLKDFKSRYRAQALGLFWSLAYPLVMMATVSLAFVYILHLEIENFPIFYLIGAVLWHYFSNATLAGTGAMVDSVALIKNTSFPRFLLPVAALLANLVNLGMEALLILAFYFIYPSAYRLSIALIALPALLSIEVLLVAGITLATSCLNVRYRDVYYIITSVMTMGFWTTPVLYSTKMAPEWLRGVLRLNPLAGVIEGARDIIMQGRFPDLSDVLPGTVTAIVVFVTGMLIFRHHNRSMADYL